jgi:ABC-type Fe3+/spermidine/putrescine transport system ATPase subunit
MLEELEPSSSETIIAFRDVVKRFGQTAAVDRVTFAVNAGETVSLLGPSGCGKTTTLRLISGFEEPDSGTIEIAGETMVGKRPYERNVGLLFQHYALFPHMTVAENVAYGLKHRRWPRAEIGDRVREMLRLVQLTGFENRRPGQMSGGQQQRVALARVLATKPRLVLLDEPLSALDAKLREELRLELKNILAAVGSTTIVVTHDQDEAMSLADRIIVMNRGRIEQQGTPDDIYMRPGTAFVASFIGRNNWFKGQLSRVAAERFSHFVTSAGSNFIVRSPAVNPTGRLSACVRPERIAVVSCDAQVDKTCDNLLEAQVVDVVNMGAELHYIVESTEGRLMTVEPNRDGPRVTKGDHVCLRFRAEDCLILPENTD